jgi:hypothetical protein
LEGGRSVLEGIDEIDWRGLRDAYGPASDVPRYIRELAASDTADWNGPVENLYTHICHQGTVYEATAFAVPYLIELLTHPEIKPRHWILYLLGDIARGHSYAYEPEADSDPRAEAIDQREPPRLARERERDWVKQARAAVVAGFDQYMSLLDDHDWLVRLTAPDPLVVCDEHSSEIVAALRRVVQNDPDPRVRASALLGWGTLSKADRSYFQQCKHLLESAESDFVRLAAAMALTQFFGTEVSRAPIAVICEAILNAPAFKPLYEWLPWDDFREPGRCLQAASPALARYAASLLVDGLKQIPLSDASIVLMNLLNLFFEDPRFRRLEPASLNEERRGVLTEILSIDRLWETARPARILSVDGLPDDVQQLFPQLFRQDRARYPARLLSEYGLPDQRDTLEAFLRSK